jgi:hypothetical protein
VAAALSSAVPFNATVGGPAVPSELPVEAFRLRVADTGALVPPKAGFPRVVPYNPEAGEHVVAFQPATDLQPCTRYSAEITTALLDARRQPVQPYSWRFRTSGCRPGQDAPVKGTVTCASGAYVATDTVGRGSALNRLDACAGGQDGGPLGDAALPIAAGIGAWKLNFASGGCAALAAGQPVTIGGRIQWEDASGKVIGTSLVDRQPYDLRGGKVTVAARSRVLPGHVLALRLAPAPGPCVQSGTSATVADATGRATAWPADG